MEKNSLNNNLKHHSIGERSMKDNIIIIKNHHHHHNRVKDSWENSSSGNNGRDLLSGFSWPPRTYSCSFCKREFRSAQALGGHMNVHRRERARLRQSPPPSPSDGQYPLLNLNPITNPNPNQNPENNPVSRFPTFSLSSPSSASANEVKKWEMGSSTPCCVLNNSGADLAEIKPSKTLSGVGKFQGIFSPNSGCEILKETGIAWLDLEIGLPSGSKEDLDLDLELRLGRS